MQRIGVFVCHCGTNIAGTVDVKAVAQALKNEPGVVFSDRLPVYVFSGRTGSYKKSHCRATAHRRGRMFMFAENARGHLPQNGGGGRNQPLYG